MLLPVSFAYVFFFKVAYQNFFKGYTIKFKTDLIYKLLGC